MNEDEDLDDFEFCEQSMQMFDRPYRRPLAVAGTPISMISASEQKYRNFPDWWFKVGRLKPNDPQGWFSIFGSRGDEGSRGGDFRRRMESSARIRPEPNQVLGSSVTK